MKELVKFAAENINVINAYFGFDANYYNVIPLRFNDKLFLVINEDDFIFDGYSIFRFKDLTKVKVKNDMCDESLKNMNRNIIVQKQTIDDEDSEFIIGRIEKIYKNFAYVWHFDADGIWNDSPIKIPYSQITNITFGSRYVDVFSKYIDESPLMINNYLRLY